MKRLTLFLLFALSAAGCSRDNDDTAAVFDDPDTTVVLSVTRSGTDEQREHTYRVLLFDMTSGSYSGKSGSYYYDFSAAPDDTNKSGVLIPCRVDGQGNRIGDRDASAGLYASAGTYAMVIVSPAESIDEVSAMGNEYGFRYARVPAADQEPLRIGDSLSVTIRGRGELLSNGGNVVRDTVHIDDRGGKLLRERRAKLEFRFRCGEDIESSVLSEITLRNLIDEAFWEPVGGHFFSETFAEKGLFSGDLSLVRGQEPVVLPAAADAEADGRYIYLLAQDYSSTDDYGEPLYTLPELHVEFNTEAVLDIPLGYDFRPQYTYTYTITVNSVYVHLALTVAPWDTVPSSGNIDTPPMIDLGTFTIAGWNDGGTSGGTIE